jgi:hypothetical protein
MQLPRDSFSTISYGGWTQTFTCSEPHTALVERNNMSWPGYDAVIILGEMVMNTITSVQSLCKHLGPAIDEHSWPQYRSLQFNRTSKKILVRATGSSYQGERFFLYILFSQGHNGALILDFFNSVTIQLVFFFRKKKEFVCCGSLDFSCEKRLKLI